MLTFLFSRCLFIDSIPWLIRSSRIQGVASATRPSISSITATLWLFVCIFWRLMFSWSTFFGAGTWWWSVSVYLFFIIFKDQCCMWFGLVVAVYLFYFLHFCIYFSSCSSHGMFFSFRYWFGLHLLNCFYAVAPFQSFLHHEKLSLEFFSLLPFLSFFPLSFHFFAFEVFFSKLCFAFALL